uniref:Protein FMC1 homolog n=1 Tax=Globodera pallida TaxID=36090 RepID=A0A183BM91_GLOPA
MANIRRNQAAITIVKRISQELKKADKDFSTKCSLHKYLLRQLTASSNQQDATLGAAETQHSAQTYAIYLESKRKLDEVRAKYFLGGETTVKEAARMVGLKLPEEWHKTTNEEIASDFKNMPSS